MSVPHVSAVAISDLISLRGRPAAVTGGSMGIGYAIARRLAQAGASVLIGDIEDAENAADTIARAVGGNVIGCRLDVSDGASIAARTSSE